MKVCELDENYVKSHLLLIVPQEKHFFNQKALDP